MFAHHRRTRAFVEQESGAVVGYRLGAWLLGTLIFAVPYAAQAHGIVGNRVFSDTLTFDDPAVMDELIFPAVSNLKRPAEGADITDKGIGLFFSRLLTPSVAFEVETGWTRRSRGPAERSGFDTTSLSLKGLLYKNDLHETMLSAVLAWGIHGSGAQGIGASRPDTLSPGVFFGKGFGDAPDALAWLRPFAITGAVTLEHPMSDTSTNLDIDERSGLLAPMPTRNTDTLHWSFSLQYSTFYLTSRYTPGRLPKNEPLHQFIPLIEFAFDTPRGQKTAATISPGLAYIGEGWQLAAEAIIPVNTEGGRTVGLRAHLFLFLDDLFPALFGRPVFGP